LSKKKQEAPKESKLFDSLLKALFDEQSEEIISCLLPGSQRPAGIPMDQLNVELNRNALSIDIGRHIVHKEEHATFNLEAQSGPDDDLLPRMHLMFRLTGRYQNIRRSSVKREEWPRNEEEMAERFITLKQVEAL
jgi:hypothetical protein